MKKITLMIVASLMSFFAYAQLPVEHFDAPWTGNPAAPPDWTVINEFGPNITWVQTTPGNTQQPPFGGSGYSAYLAKEAVAPTAAIPSDWLVTKSFPMPANAELKFQSRLTILGDQGSIYKVYVMPATLAPTVANFTSDAAYLLATFSELQLNPSQTDWTEKLISIPNNALWSVGTQVRVAFLMQGADHDRWFLDDVLVAAACVAPTTGIVASKTMDSASLTWTSEGVTAWEIEVIAAEATPTGTGVPYSGALPYVAGGLTQCKDYKFYVRNNCGDSKSPWLGPVYFKTSCLGETCASPIVIPGGNYSDTNNTENFSDFYEGIPGTGCNSSGNYLAGNDVVYAYTANATGNYSVTLTNTNGPAGMFIYSACANIGSACIGGGTATATAPVNLSSFAMTAGTTYYIVVSTNGSPQTTPYTLTIQQVFCPQPTAGSATGVTGTSAILGWTPGSTGASSWQMVVQPQGTGLPASGPVVATSAGNNVTTTTGGTALVPATTYEFYVRESCAGGNYSIWAGPFLFTTSQVATPIDYYQNFDGADPGFTLANGTETNRWVVGTATSNSPTKSLYISNDNGVTNAYANGTTSLVHAYKTLLMPPTVDQLSLSFDWKAYGESCCDFINVWVVPDSYTPTPGIAITEDDGVRIGERRNLSATWQTSNTVITAPAEWDGALVKLVFEWTNDFSVGSNPPAAIDNVAFKVVTCPQPSDLAVQDLNVTQAIIEWTAPSVIPAIYDIYASQSSTPPGAATAPTQTVPGTQTTATITPLITSANYFVWVRSHCSDTDQSFWTGPVSFNTPQIPADMPYAQNFDAGAHNFTLSNATAINQWVVGTSTSSSPTQSLYVSNDGTTYGYDSFNYTVVHAYRDIQLPANIPSEQILLNFDWKSLGDQWGSDVMKVYIAPVTFSPTVGTEINEGGDIVRSGPDYNNGDDWQTANNVIDVPTTWNGTVRRVIFEWKNSWGGGVMPAAVDNVGLSVITCPAPSDITLDGLTVDSATISWTAPASAPGSYDYYFSTDATNPVETTAPTGSTADTNVMIPGLAVSTYYNFWVRSDCGATDGNSFWVGPLKFVTPQTPATMPYAENFDGAAPNYSFNTSNDNEWVVGTATSNSPTQSLYVTQDGGVTNSYNGNDGLSIVHAYRDIQLPATIASGQVLLNFDWKSVGVEWGADVLRVYVAPVTFGPTAGEQVGANPDVIAVGGDLYDNNVWITANNVVDIPAAWNGNIVRVIFEWENSWSSGNTPAAIDNVGFSVITCSAPTDVILASIDENNATFTWTAPADAPDSYEYYLTTSPVPPVAGTVPTGTGITGTTLVIPGLPANTNYFIWIRSNCGTADGNSFWVGGNNFNTPQVPAVLPYAENFEGANPDYTIISLNEPNTWAVGGATFSSPSKSLYVTNDNGVTNGFTDTEESIIHAYRDVVIPTGTAELDFTFDWKGVGEQWGGDYLSVWMVPLNYLPVAGSEITDSDGVKVTPDNLYNNAVWKNENFVIPIDAAQAGTTQRFVFQWVNNSFTGGNPPSAVDNVEAKVLTCPKPIDLNVSDAGMTEVTLNWTEVGTANAWEVYVVPQGSPLPGTTTVGTPAPTNGFPYDGLTSGTNYEFYVRSVCGPGDLSRWSGPYRFHTNVCEVTDQCTYNFVMTSTGGGWNGNTVSVLQSGILIATFGDTFTDGEGPETVPVQLCTGIPYEVLWNEGGYGDIGLAIVNDFNNQTVFNKVAGSGESEKTTVIYQGLPYCSEITCPQPTNLVSVSVVNAVNTTNLSWTPGGTELQWEVVVQLQDAGFPGVAPTVETVSEPHLVVDELVPGTLYEYYVRSICADGNTSFWSGPLRFSVFAPPVCADVTVVDDNLDVVVPDTEYVICAGDDVNVHFSANYYEGAAQTTSYEVSSIPFVVTFPTTGGTQMNVDIDDSWAPKVTLPFEFCFMGDVYNAAQVGANGAISFDTTHPANQGGTMPWSFSQTIPDTSFPVLNAIYGVYQDTDPSINNSFAHPTINYQVLGNYPCRALVVNFNELAQFSGDCNSDPSVGPQTSQIVLYEITNIIEVYVTRRVPCPEWQNGVGVIGLQNADGTLAFTPPNRNTGDWTATNEAWRFTPNGDSTATIEWLQDGSVVGNTKDIDVTVSETGTTTMTARASYLLCNGNTIVRESNFAIKVQEQIIPANEPVDITRCGNGEDVTFDLNEAVANAFDAAEMPNYSFTFYTTQADAEAGDTNNIPTDFVTNATTTLWVRIMRVGQPCFVVYSFDAIVSNNPPKFTLTADQSVCEGNAAVLTVTPDAGEDLSTATYTWTLDGNPIADTTATISVTTAGEYVVTVTKGGCVDTKTSTVTVVAVPVADAPTDVEACGSYVLPALSAGNNYYTGTNGTGTQLSAGETITATQQIFVYAAAEGNTACSAQNFFEVTISASPEFTFLDDCESNVYYVEVTDVNGSFDTDRATYSWTGPDGFTSTERKMTPQSTGEYTVTVTTEGGCVSSDTFEVLSTTCMIPRGISPNGDGKNDEFDLSALNVKRLEVFNRYGQQVYSKSNYTSEFVGKGNNGDELPTGTYFYMIERSNGESITGWVYINREEK
ncbi:fibronectin type III domain-containing protein [Flavobacterium sp. DG1-102-2]|uniref:fibronectin type III domain-containing protein n=1 Tax=Flavobacterium sp. DG1-102-2 TaxID=3081663 RepID=UPI002949723D|nr:fibronectin type III domain-containing protein [Flavobacterium sp. DG1-102-2]MDV6170371.1 fibronectin type III domain-containing protein [Flavobacterium sp. DG1-102-2]